MGSNHKPEFFRQAGFSLVEILVGLVIGLLATLVILQVFSIFEGQKRTTTGVADAQTNGSIALFTLARDITRAGFGLEPTGIPAVNDSPIECATLSLDPALTYSSAGAAIISPAIITDGNGASDSIVIHYGTSDMGGVPSVISAAGSPGVKDVAIPTNLACQPNDVALIFNGGACALTTVAVAGVSAANVAPAIITLNTLPAQAVVGASLACLGKWNEITYRVNNNNLEQNGVPILADIVNIQAQYGISATTGSNQVVQWVDATGATWAAPTVANRNRIKAIRVAVVARNGLLEKENVSSDCIDLTSNQPAGVCAWSATSLSPINPSPAPHVDLSNIPNWQRYRYRVFETVIPLRNVLWSKTTL
jgi:type IV pilus assembly protein PilW